MAEEQAKRQMTPEEMKQRKLEMDLFFKEEIPFLEEQTKYETLVTGIEELRARRVRAQQMIASALAPPPPDDLTGKQSGSKTPKTE